MSTCYAVIGAVALVIAIAVATELRVGPVVGIFILTAVALGVGWLLSGWPERD